MEWAWNDKNHMIISYKNKGGERLDKFLKSRFSNHSRNYFQKLIEDNKVTVNNTLVKPNYTLKAGDQIQIKFSKEVSGIKLSPADIKLDILFENNDLIAINKPAGMTVHPGAGDQDQTLVNALINYYPNIRFVTHDQTDVSKIRPGIVHRLDKDTTGIIVVAKNQHALKFISEQISLRKVKKIYLAICFEWPKLDSGTIISYLGRSPKNRKVISDIGIECGRKAVSSYKVKKYFKKNNIKLSLIEFDIKTGRTHQIRFQAKSIGTPILGDRVYNTKESVKAAKILMAKRQLLHAKEISFTLADSNKLCRLSAPIPPDFQNILE